MSKLLKYLINPGKRIVDADNIIFDFGGVLMKHNLIDCRRAFRNYMSDNTFYTRLGIGNENPQGTLVDAYNRGMDTETFIAEVLKICKPGTTPEDVIWAWNMLHDNVPEERWEQICELRAKGYRTYLFSNTNELHWHDTMTKYQAQIEECFDGIFLSFMMHCAKPDKRIFKMVDKAIGADPERTKFVDDSLANREAAAKYVLWETCWDMKSLFSSIEIERLADEVVAQYSKKK